MSRLFAVLLAGGLGLAACGEEAPGERIPDGPYRTQLAELGALIALSAQTSGVPDVKYLAPVAGRPSLPPLTAACYFQDMRQHAWHLQFLRSFPELDGLTYEAYVALVVQPSRRLWGGSVTWRSDVRHPGGGAAGVVTYTVYDESGSLGVDGVAEVDRTLKGCAPFARQQLVFLAETPAQEGLLMREQAALDEAGVVALTRKELMVP